MLVGREYRKSVSQAFAFAAYRWIAIWLIIAACASKGDLGIACGLVVVAADIIATGNFIATAFALNEQTRKDWLDLLTNRIFYKLLFEQIRGGSGAAVDVDELFNLASKEAVADMKRAAEDSAVDAGFFDKTGWHWIGGVLSFIWRCVSSILYYGSALYVGSVLLGRANDLPFTTSLFF